MSNPGNFQTFRTTADIMFREVADFIGLKGFEIEAVAEALEPSVSFRLTKRFNYLVGMKAQAESDKAFFEALMTPIIKGIEESRATQSMLAEAKERVGVLELELRKTEKEVSRLKHFESYYYLQFTMNNGEPPKTIRVSA